MEQNHLKMMKHDWEFLIQQEIMEIGMLQYIRHYWFDMYVELVLVHRTIPTIHWNNVLEKKFELGWI